MAERRFVNRALFGALAIATWYSTTWPTKESSEHPVRSIILASLVAYPLLLLVSSVYPRDSKDPIRRRASGFAVNSLSNEEATFNSPLRACPLPGLRKVLPSRLRRRQLELLVLVACIVLRVETLRRIHNEVACSWGRVEATLLPILLVLYDFWEGRELSLKDDETDKMSQTVFEEFNSSFYSTRARYLVPTFLLSSGVYLSSKGVLPSTYICSVVSSGAYTVTISEILGVFFDAGIIIITWRLLKDMDLRQRMATVTSIVCYSATALTLLSIPCVLFNMNQGSWFSSLLSASLWSTLADGLALATVLFCVSYVALEIRPLGLVVLLVFCCTYALLVESTWSTPRIFPPQPKMANAIGLLLLVVAFGIFMLIYRVSEVSKVSTNFAKRVPIWFYLVLIVSLIPTEIIIMRRTTKAGSSHPIFSLTYNARTEADRWRVQAASSISIETAVREYRLRHRGRSPPPNFDKWYDFAIARGCPVIDDYDQIDRDLLPFWAMDPVKIRTLSPAQTGWNGIAAVAIRSGQVIYGQYDGPDKQWLPHETISMIESFSQWLPDMNIGINVRQVPRIAKSWKQTESMRRRAFAAKSNLQYHDFSSNFEQNWPTPFLNNEDLKERVEAIMSEQHKTPGNGPPPLDYPDLNGLVCPPKSKTGHHKSWGKHDFCASCADPHSTGQFMNNWTLAGELCHQPDLMSLHGFFSSSNVETKRRNPDKSWVGFQDLMVPIFSRSKISGYNDILIPGPDDYVEVNKAGPYNSGFYNLADSLYWAGPADEGDSLSREWQGMQQQRLVHLANNITATNVITMLLPSMDGEQFVYENVPASEAAQLLNMDISFTSFERCGTRDCLEQKIEFGTNNAASNLESTYRYLIDMDTVGASQKFLSYLRSGSVPFRASIFRTWYDDRLTPWLHFVPIDSRFHAVHSTLAYFTGLKGKFNGREVEMKGNHAEAEFIAGQGKKWAEKALRKEDAEAYLFRLLLEWGRVTDDRRDEIGYEYVV